jgi:hypothetical protein
MEYQMDMNGLNMGFSGGFGMGGWGCFNPNQEKIHVEEAYTAAYKGPGCGPHEKCERTIELKIPQFIAIDKIPDHATMQDRLIMNNTLGTIHGRLLQVTYFLKIFVKHQALTEFGEGNNAAFPIYLNQAPVTNYCAIQKPQYPPNWSP